MKLILCTLAAILAIGALTVHPADAACWWNGWGWQCWHHPYWHAYWGHHWGWHHWHHWHHWRR